MVDYFRNALKKQVSIMEEVGDQTASQTISWDLKIWRFDLNHLQQTISF